MRETGEETFSERPSFSFTGFFTQESGNTGYIYSVALPGERDCIYNHYLGSPGLSQESAHCIITISGGRSRRRSAGRESRPSVRIDDSCRVRRITFVADEITSDEDDVTCAAGEAPTAPPEARRRLRAGPIRASRRRFRPNRGDRSAGRAPSDCSSFSARVDTRSSRTRTYYDRCIQVCACALSLY